MSKSIELNESKIDAEKGFASTNELVLQKKFDMVDIVLQLENVAGKQGGEDSVLGRQGDDEPLVDET